MFQIVEDMLAAQQREHEFDLYVQEELQKLPPCEGPLHPLGQNGHRSEESAKYLMAAPCGRDSLRCAAYVEDTLLFAWIRCDSGGCGERHQVSDLTFVPLVMD
jgi:hypothetical protein